MLEMGLSGSEGGVALTTPSLPLSNVQQSFRVVNATLHVLRLKAGVFASAF